MENIDLNKKDQGGAIQNEVGYEGFFLDNFDKIET